jgi:hypothetical protein
MKKLFVVLMVSLMSMVFVNCTSSTGNDQNGQIVVNAEQPNIGDNLDLRALGEIVKSSSNPTEIERKLNADDGINNLDLDGDGNKDYLKVSEYGQGAEHGYSICAVLKDGEPEVANVIVNTDSKQMSLNGNPEYYGNNNTYQSSFSTTDFLLLAWLMQPHYTYYHSPYHYGYYGYGYMPRRVVPYHSYYSRPVIRTSVTHTYTVPKTRTVTKIKSPNSNNKSTLATKRVSNFSNATSSQKSFKVNSSNKSYKNSTGFGTNKSSNTKSNSGFGTSSKPTSSPSKSTGFGSSSKQSKSPGFGSSSKSSSSKSSSSSSKSSSFGSSSKSSKSSSFGSSSRSSSSRSSSSRSSSSRR